MDAAGCDRSMGDSTAPATLPDIDRGQPRTTAVNAAASAYAELATVLQQRQPLSAVLNLITQITANIVDAADEVSITLIEAGQARSVAFNGLFAVSMDELQYRDGYGPCMDAAVSRSVIRIEDTISELTYPSFAAGAARAGVRHVLSIPIPALLPQCVGSLNLYGRVESFSTDDCRAAVAFASYAGTAVAIAAAQAGAVEEPESLFGAMADCALIEQAKGIIMAGHHCDADQAFDLLRSSTTRGNRNLRDIAQDLVRATAR